MAKVGKLAGLAALGALAYMNRDKLGMGSKKETDTGDETDRLKARKPAPLKTPEESISERMVKPDNTGENYSNEGLGKGINQANASGTTTLGPAYNESSKPAKPAKLSAPKPAVSRKAPSVEDGMKNYSTRSGSLAGAGRGSVNPPVANPSGPRDSEAGMSRGTRAASSEDGMKNYKPRYTPPMLASKTTQGAGRKPYMPEDVDMGIGQKRGGMVKKMASGGMTASRRADGIATKGKTRGKIC